jgi:hypothetical protein
MLDLLLYFGSAQTRWQTRSLDFKALLCGLNLLFQCMWLGTVSQHDPTPLWWEHNCLSVTDSYRGRSGDEDKVNAPSPNVCSLVYIRVGAARSFSRSSAVSLLPQTSCLLEQSMFKRCGLFETASLPSILNLGRERNRRSHQPIAA